MAIPPAFYSEWRNSGLRVLSLFTDRDPRHLPPVMRRPAKTHWRLHLLIEGHLELQTPAGPLSLTAAVATLMRPDDSYQVSVAATGARLWLVTADFEMLTTPGWADPLRRIAQPAVVTFDQAQDIASWASTIPEHEDRDAALARRPAVDYLLSTVLRRGFDSGALVIESGSMPRWLVDLRREIIQGGFLKKPDFDLPGMARLAGVSEAHLCRSFRRHLACTPLEWLHRERITNACRALRHGDQRLISDIALESGYRSQVLFSRHFRRLMGCNARTWRRQTLGGVDLSLGRQQPS